MTLPNGIKEKEHEMLLTHLELMPWIQKGDKNFYNETLAGADLSISSPVYGLRMASNSENARTVRLSEHDVKVLLAISRVYPSRQGKRPVMRRLDKGGYSVKVSGPHRVLADLLSVAEDRMGILAAEIKASLGIEFHCYAPDGTQWLA